MDVRLSRAKAPIGKGDPHDWNTYDHYRTIHEKYVDDHFFVDHARTNQLQFKEKEERFCYGDKCIAGET